MMIKRLINRFKCILLSHEWSYIRPVGAEIFRKECKRCGMRMQGEYSTVSDSGFVWYRV
jgi:hypothetical protein